MYFFLIAVLTTTISATVGLKCGEADTPLPPYPNLPSGTVFNGFMEMERKSSNKIASMFRESGVSRQCVTWEPPPNDKCELTMRCRSFACFGHQSNEPGLDPLTHVTVEVYGYAQEKGWAAVAFSRNATLPLINAAQIECLRKDSDVITQISHYDDKGKRRLVNEKTFLKQVDYVADPSPLLKNHLYCKVYMDEILTVIYSGVTDVFDFKKDKFYPIPAVGSDFTDNHIGSPCSRPVPRSAIPINVFKSFEPSKLDRWYLVIHGWIMVFCFIFLFPCSVFPIRYLRLQLNNDNASWGIKQYKKTHILYALPMYPLMLISWYLARCAHGNQIGFVPTISSSFFHGTVGTTCMQMFFIQGFLLLFSYGALLIESNKFYIFWHTFINYISYLFIATSLWSLRTTRYTGLTNAFQGWLNFFLMAQFLMHFIMTFYHWFIRLFNYKDDGYFMPAQTPSITKALTQGTKEIQRQPCRNLQMAIWWVHDGLCFVITAIMIYVIQPDNETLSPEYSKDILPKLTWAGEINWEWPYYWLYVG